MERVGKFFTMPPGTKTPPQQASLSDMWAGSETKKVKREDRDEENLEEAKESVQKGVDENGAGPSGSKAGMSKETPQGVDADEDVQMDGSEAESKGKKSKGKGKGKKVEEKVESMEVDGEQDEAPKKSTLSILLARSFMVLMLQFIILQSRRGSGS